MSWTTNAIRQTCRYSSNRWRNALTRRGSSQFPSRANTADHLRFPGFRKQPALLLSTTTTNNKSVASTVAEWIQEKDDARQIMVLCGAGVSVSANIPDFRTPGTGLYDNLHKYNLPYPEAIFDLQYYQSRPQAFLSLAKEIWPGKNHRPTITHSFLALLEQKNLLLRCYSQNIDGLEFLGGVSADRVVECHGHFRTASCTSCGAKADIEQVRQSILREDPPQVPICQTCKVGYVKPDIVFFGEALPDQYSMFLRRDLRKATLLLILGTSLQVAPVSQIPQWVREDCRRVLINRELVGDLDLREQDNPMDVFLEGDCDDSVMEICGALGWEDEILKLHEATKVERDECAANHITT